MYPFARCLPCATLYVVYVYQQKSSDLYVHGSMLKLSSRIQFLTCHTLPLAFQHKKDISFHGHYLKYHDHFFLVVTR